MLTRSLCAVACLVLAGAVLGQSTSTRARTVLGKAAELEGLVTVSDGAAVSRVVLNQPVIRHTRYVTSSTGYVTLKMDNGCDIVLKPNQALTVDDEQDCGALWAAIESLGGNYAIAPFIVGGAVILLLGGGGGAGDPPSLPPGGGGVVPTPPGDGDVTPPPPTGGGGPLPEPPILSPQ
jgi:hypothetical protein